MTHPVLKDYIWWDNYHIRKDVFLKMLYPEKKEKEKEDKNPPLA